MDDVARAASHYFPANGRESEGMKARDVMTTQIVAATPDTPIREVARLLIDKGISAVPIVDGNGMPIGMVSEGDLIGHSEAPSGARRDWWLALLAEGENLSPDFLASLHPLERTARQVMSSPVVTVGEETELEEIARLLTAHRIKRVPVVRDGRIVGIVSRADLVRAVALGQSTSVMVEGAPPKPSLFAFIDEHFHTGKHPTAASERAEAPSLPAAVAFTADDFRHLMADFEREKAEHLVEDQRAAAERRRQIVKAFIDHHIDDRNWQGLLHGARQAAEQGKKEFMLLRFPSQLCSDSGRAINAADPHWPETLRGEAAEIYLRWERELKSHGFHLSARILDFPGGFPGEVGLVLVWS